MRNLSARTNENRARTRELALTLAQIAEDIANTFERAAAMHEAIAGDPRHPLSADAAAYAAIDRAWAEHERNEAERFRSRVASLR